MRKYCVLFALMCCSVFANAQILLERIVDSALVKEQHEFIMSKLDSAYIPIMGEYIHPFESKDCVIHEIYNCHDTCSGLNFVLYKEPCLNLVDTNKFSKNYFVSGEFLEDWVELKEQGKVLINYYMFAHDVFIFDTVNNKSYSISDTPCSFGYFIDRNFQAEENDFLGILFKSDTIDFVFHYPTFTHHDGGPEVRYISWELGYCFGMKGSQFFYIDTWKEKIYPMEWVVENHWEWITNVKEK